MKNSKITLSVISMILSMLIVNTTFVLSVNAEYVYDIQDECANTSLMVPALSTTANLSLATSAQTWAGAVSGVGGDKNRLYKTSHAGDLDLNTYVTYNVNNPITYFKAVTGIFKTTGGVYTGLTFETSTDGVVFSPFTGLKSELADTSTAWTNNSWRMVNWISTEPLPSNTTYLRIRFGSTTLAGLSVSSLQLMKVFVSTDVVANQDYVIAKKAELSGTITQVTTFLQALANDNVNYSQAEYDTLINKKSEAEAAILDDNATIDGINSIKDSLLTELGTLKATITYKLPFYDDCSTFERLSYVPSDVKTVNSSVEQIKDLTRIAKSGYVSTYVVYKVADAFSYFNVEAALVNVTDKGIPNDMTFEVSSDGQSYTPVSGIIRTEVNTSNTTWTSGKYRIVSYESSSISENSRYLKIIFADTTGLNTYCNQIANVSINANKINAGTIMVVDSDEFATGVNTVDKLKSATSITVKANVTKTTDDISSAVVTATIFDGNVFKAIGCTTTDFSSSSITISGIDVPSGLTDPYIKLYVWDNYNNLIPYTVPVTYLK